MAINFLSSIDIAGTASLSSVSNDNSSYTGILVWDGGLLKYRTKSQLLTDIGGDINNYVSSISFDTTNGILSLPRTGLSTLTVDLDGRYALESGNVDGSGTTNFVAKWLDSNTIQNSIIFDDGTNVIINATNAAVNIGTTISTTPVGGHPNTGAGTLIVGGKTNAGYNYQPGVITLINQNPSIAAGADTGIIQFVGKDDATSGYASANIKAFTAAAAGTGNSGGGIITLGTSPGYGGPVERFRINQNGNVGIGTTSPARKLQVSYSSTTAPGFSIKNTNTTVNNNVVMAFNRDNSDSLGWTQGIDSGDNSFKISEDGDNLETNPRIVILSGGNVGIGTTSPSEKLDVSGNAIVRGDIVARDTYPSIYVDHSGTVMGGIRADATSKLELKTLTTAPLSFQVNSSEKMRILDNGNVGIGTTSPGANLEIRKSASDNIGPVLRLRADDSNDGNPEIQLYRGSGSAVGSRIYLQNGNTDLHIDNLYDGSSTYGRIFFRTQTIGTPINAMTIMPGGNVGIGTTSPSKLLEVKSSTAYNSTVRLSTTAHNWDIQGGETGYSSTAFALDYDGTTFFRAMGTTDARFSGGISVGTINATPPTGGLYVAGNVGIGTTSPSNKLQVAGGISAGGKATYSKSAGSLDTTGYAVAGLTTASNGQSAGFTFTCFGHTGKYQKIVYSCWNAAGTWNTSKVIDEGTNDFNIEASANGTTITFTFKSRSGSKSYTPRVTVEATGTAINNTYA